MVSPKDRPRLSPLGLLGLLAFAWFALPSGWKIISENAFDEFQAPLWDATSRISDLSEYWGHQSDSKRTLIRKNRDLARIRSDWELHQHSNGVWEKELAKLRELKSNLKALENQLGLDAQNRFRPVIARVCNRMLSGWWQELTLRRGASDGLKEGMGVLARQGIAGRIRTAGSKFAKVELCSNPNFRIVCHFEGDDRPVTFQGSGISAAGKPTGVVLDVPHDLEVDSDHPVYLTTSELGGTYPKGIRIGVVDSLKSSGDGLFKTGHVLLPDSLGRLEEVTVLLPLLATD